LPSYIRTNNPFDRIVSSYMRLSSSYSRWFWTQFGTCKLQLLCDDCRPRKCPCGHGC